MHIQSICTTIMVLYVATTTFAKQEGTNTPGISELNQQLDNNQLDTKQYLDAVDDWVTLQFASGMHYDRDTMISRLIHYRRLAWSADSLNAYRINYYINLSNNANYGNREGESVYFLEKAEQEILAAHGEKPLLVAGRKSNTYIDKRNYDNVIRTYEKERAYIEQFPELLRKKSINLNIAISFINVLDPAIHAYAAKNDTANVAKTLALAEAIYGPLVEQIKPTSANAFITAFYMKELYYYKYAILLKDREQTAHALADMEQALYGDTTRPAPLIGMLEPVLVTKQVEYHLTYKNNDSAAHYLAKLKSMPGVFTDHDFTLHRYEAELLANQGLYRTAYERAKAATQSIDSIQSILVNDIDTLLYAHTDAEYSRLALQESERVKNQRKWWLIGIILLSIGGIVGISFLLARKSKQAKKLIDKLNNAANLQVAAMEEITAQAVRQEQQRLGRDLHDGLSATLAAIKHQIELLTIDNPDADINPKLVEIGEYVEQAHAIARGKSHQWYRDGETFRESDFQNHIQTLLDSALPDSRYAKAVHVDDDALSDVALETRIELLRIIQEGVTNIIRHARATKVNVLIYNEADRLVLSIADNGRGLNIRPHTKGQGLGLPSIEHRVAVLGGSLAVNNGGSGVELIAYIPQPA